jgi:hypothetical protein
MCVPTDKQIAFADEIAYVLGIDFPTGSPDFNKLAYQKFISDNINQYREIMAGDPNYDDEMDWWDPFAEGGY